MHTVASTAQATPQPPADAKPFDLQTVTLSRREHIALVMQAKQYRSLHTRAVQRLARQQSRHEHQLAGARQREATLHEQLEFARAQLRDLRQRLFGTRTERSRSINLKLTGSDTDDSAAIDPQVQAPQPDAPHQGARRRRGQQPGARGHGRRLLTNLPLREHRICAEIVCPSCKLAAQPIAGTQDAQVLEVQVKAYRRIVRRQRFKPACQCGALPGLVAPAAPAQLIPRGKLGVSIWVQVLLSKYLYGQPTERLLCAWRDQGLSVAQGTVTDGLQRLAPLFAPLVAAGLQRLQAAPHWHADETRWQVFEDVAGKVGHRWYLWVFHSDEVVSFILDPTRSAAVPARALAGVSEGVLSVDRYAAYGKWARSRPGVKLAICWAHQRRDFLRVANDHPALWSWAMRWLQGIGELYALHRQRRQRAATVTASLHQQQADVALAANPAYQQSHKQLREHLDALLERCRTELADATTTAPARKVLLTMQHYAPGLATFMQYPLLDLDNNAAERVLRPAVVARKNFYGSGSQWSGQLAAAMMSVLATTRLWKLNPSIWLTEYLNTCAQHGGQPPPDCSAFLPWQMDAKRLAALRATGQGSTRLQAR